MWLQRVLFVEADSFYGSAGFRFLLQCWSSLLRGDGQKLNVHHFTVYSGSCGDGKEPQNVGFGPKHEPALPYVLLQGSCCLLCLVFVSCVVDGGLTFGWEFQTGAAMQACKEQPELHKAALCCAGCCPGQWAPPHSLKASR